MSDDGQSRMKSTAGLIPVRISGLQSNSRVPLVLLCISALEFQLLPPWSCIANSQKVMSLCLDIGFELQISVPDCHVIEGGGEGVLTQLRGAVGGRPGLMGL